MTLENDAMSLEPPRPNRVPTIFNNPWTKPELAWQKRNLLSLDGGGVRGYWSLLVLNKLIEKIAYIEQLEDQHVEISGKAGHSFYPENYPKHVSKNISDLEQERIGDAEQDDEEEFTALENNRRYLPCHYFDYICGSSTGSLIAIMLGRLRMTVCDCLYEYESLISTVFGKPRIFTKLSWIIGFNKYSTKRLEAVFKKVVDERRDNAKSRRGQNGFRSRKKVCRTFATSFMSKCTKTSEEPTRTRYLIRSYDHQKNAVDDQSNYFSGPSRASTGASEGSRASRHRAREINYGPAEPMEVWQVARAATAAPLYFDHFDGEILEGKTFNRYVYGGLHVTNNPTWEGVEEVWERHGPGSLNVVCSVGTSRTNERPGRTLKKQVKSIVAMATDPQNIHETALRRSTTENNQKNYNYFRFNDSHSTGVDMDECDPRGTSAAGTKTFDKLRNHFYSWVRNEEVTKQLRRCAILLVLQRRARTTDQGAWEAFSTGSEYSCPYQGCEEILSNRYELQAHLEASHKQHLELDDRGIKRRRDVWRYRKD